MAEFQEVMKQWRRFCKSHNNCGECEFDGKGIQMPMERERYPDNWREIAYAVKEAAGWKCQKCGKQCRKPGEPFDTHKRTLTVSHLNHTPEDVRIENLMAMCAPCHLKYDAQHHAETRRKKRESI